MKICAASETTLMDLLVVTFPDWSKSRIRQLMKFKKVRRGAQALVRADTPVLAGEELELDLGRDPSAGKSFRPNFPLLYEDHFLLVAVKPPGLLTAAGGEEGEHDTFLGRVSTYVRENSNGKFRALLVHRLDREVSGILVFAKTHAIQEKLKDNWPSQTKRYLAFVQGRPPQLKGTVSSWLHEGPDQRVFSGPESPEAKHAVTHYRVVESRPPNTLLEIELQTGRKNQIRVHMSDLGCPIVGDRRHGADSTFHRRVRLHAWYFRLIHPVTGKPHEFKSEMPPGFLRLRQEHEKY
jgi:23S rRNA pseudouridine1911/1915/1917 synthase